MIKYLGKNVLVTIGDTDAVRQTRFAAISPNAKFCCLDGVKTIDESIGWIRCSEVAVVDYWDNEEEAQYRNYY